MSKDLKWRKNVSGKENSKMYEVASAWIFLEQKCGWRVTKKMKRRAVRVDITKIIGGENILKPGPL